MASYGDFGWRSSMVEHLICNEAVGGSSPLASSRMKVRRDRGKAGEFLSAPFTKLSKYERKQPERTHQVRMRTRFQVRDKYPCLYI